MNSFSVRSVVYNASEWFKTARGCEVPSTSGLSKLVILFCCSWKSSRNLVRKGKNPFQFLIVGEVCLSNALLQSYLSPFSHRGSFVHYAFHKKSNHVSSFVVHRDCLLFFYATHWQSVPHQKIGRSLVGTEFATLRRMFLSFFSRHQHWIPVVVTLRPKWRTEGKSDHGTLCETYPAPGGQRYRAPGSTLLSRRSRASALFPTLEATSVFCTKIEVKLASSGRFSLFSRQASSALWKILNAELEASGKLAEVRNVDSNKKKRLKLIWAEDLLWLQTITFAELNRVSELGCIPRWKMFGKEIGNENKRKREINCKKWTKRK